MEYILLTDNARRKIEALVDLCPDEVGWHMLIQHNPKSKKHTIYDIIVYPQYVTGTSVNPSQEEYGKWLTDIIQNQPKIFQKLRGHGHSHVDMNVFSSGTDSGFQQDITNVQPQDKYYIFLITNKRKEMLWIMYKGQEQIPCLELTPELWAKAMLKYKVKRSEVYEPSEIRRVHQSEVAEREPSNDYRSRSNRRMDRRTSRKARSKKANRLRF